jgi:hypothetical protein
MDTVSVSPASPRRIITVCFETQLFNSFTSVLCSSYVNILCFITFDLGIFLLLRLLSGVHEAILTLQSNFCTNGTQKVQTFSCTIGRCFCYQACRPRDISDVYVQVFKVVL